MNRLSARVVILLYHRVSEPTSPDPFALAVTPQHFAEHLEAFTEYGPVVPLRQLLGAGKLRRLPHRGVVITFDDGYADNLQYAKPLLARFNAPATVFVTTGYLGAQREFWWDELERLVLMPGTLPEVIRLRIDGKTYEFHAGATGYDQDDYRRNRSWRVSDEESGPRQLLYRALYQALNPVADGPRQEGLEQLRLCCGTERIVRRTHRPMSIDELRQLAADDLVEIGAHTVTHPPLAKLPPNEQRSEVRKSKAELEDVLSRRVNGFSYPFGHRHSTGETASLVRDAGFEYACSTFATALSRRADPFQLPRIMVTDSDGAVLSSRLREWFLG